MARRRLGRDGVTQPRRRGRPSSAPRPRPRRSRGPRGSPARAPRARPAPRHPRRAARCSPRAPRGRCSLRRPPPLFEDIEPPPALTRLIVRRAGLSPIRSESVVPRWAAAAWAGVGPRCSRGRCTRAGRRRPGPARRRSRPPGPRRPGRRQRGRCRPRRRRRPSSRSLTVIRSRGSGRALPAASSQCWSGAIMSRSPSRWSAGVGADGSRTPRRPEAGLRKGARRARPPQGSGWPPRYHAAPMGAHEASAPRRSTATAIHARRSSRARLRAADLHLLHDPGGRRRAARSAPGASAGRRLRARSARG